MNRLAYLLAGVVVGAAGMAIAKEVKKNGNGLQGVVQGGHSIVEKVMGAAETIKEDVEDYLAEAKYKQEEKVAAEVNESDAAELADEDDVALAHAAK